MLADFMEAKKPPIGAAKAPPDPLRYGITDFAPWFAGSVFDVQQEFSEHDAVKAQAGSILSALGLTTRNWKPPTED